MKALQVSFRSMGFTALLSILSFSAIAQDNISDLFKSSEADASKLIGAYLNPFFKGMGTSLNTGWNNTASPKKLGRFELRFGLTGAIIPEKDKLFDVTKIGLSDRIKPTDPLKILSPTIGGEEVNGPEMTLYDNNGNSFSTFTMPQGAKLPFVPAPQLQASVGLLKGIDVTLRAIPEVKLGKDAGKLGMLGGGVKVDLVQFIAGKMADRVVPFELAASVGYTQFTYEYPLDVQANGSNHTDQNLEAKFSGVNMEAIISKRLLFFTPFLSVGYQSSKSNVDLKGTYPFETGFGTYTEIVNPISISERSLSGLRTNLGFQINLLSFRLYGSYSLGAYKAFNAGLGFGIGK